MKVLIYGIKSTAKIIAEILLSDHNFKVAGYIGNEKEKKNYLNKKISNNLYFMGSLADVNNLINSDNEIIGYIVGTSNLKAKEEIYYNLEKLNLFPINAISKKSDISVNTKIHKGVVVGKNSIILSETEVGNNVYIGTNTTIENNVLISNNCNIGSNVVIGSNVEIGRGVSISSGVKIQCNIKIGKNQHIKSGITVDSDLSNKIRI
tara:strand:- start:1516 stop:2133 length:618 start_codon:yes stop_codon:yes gene_type:complete